MGFPGTWMTESESMVYRVVPKCACSTIGQIMYYSDHGEFFEGDIHDRNFLTPSTGAQISYLPTNTHNNEVQKLDQACRN